MEQYATVEELEEYVGDTVGDAERLLKRATELVDYHSQNRINEENSVHLESAKIAVCAQVEWWLEFGELGTENRIESVKIGSVDIDFREDKKGKVDSLELAPRARGELFKAGLLTSAVSYR